MYTLRRCAPLLKNLSKQFPNKSLRCVVYLSTSVKPSVDTDWLNSEMKKANPNLLVLDTTWNRFVNGHELYLESHIPKAQHFDLNACTEPTRLIPRAIPEQEAFQKYLRSLGVSQDSHIVVYDRDDFDKTTTASAPRTWWTFRFYGIKNVSVLNGGYLQWIKDGFTAKSGKEPEPAQGDVELVKDTSLVRTFEEMQKIVEGDSSLIVDTRRPANFLGELPEPSEITMKTVADRKLPEVKAEEMVGGHMKNAKNIPYITLFQPKSAKQLNKEEYLQMFEKAGLDLNKPITSTCYIGHTACIFALAAAVCGKEDVSVYSGSWTEWGQRMAQRT